MAFEIITVAFNTETKSFFTDELNKFCINKKIIDKKVEFFKDQTTVYYSVFIEYEHILEKINIEAQKGLTEAGRLCFNKLREWRKVKSEEEGVPPFVIAKNSSFI